MDHCFRSSLVVITVLAVGGTLLAELPADLPPATAKAYEAFKAKDQNPVYGDASILANLAAAKDADLCFLDFASAHRGAHDYRFLACVAQLGKLNTDRTFKQLMDMLEANDSSTRTVAIDLLADWHRPEAVTALLPHLHAKDGWERSAAVYTLAKYQDPHIDPAIFELFDDEQSGLAARLVLSTRQCEAAYEKFLEVLRISPDDEHAFANVAAYHRLRSVEALLVAIRALEAKGGSPRRVLEVAYLRLSECLADALPALGEYPDDTAEQWTDYWERVKPLVDDHLRPKHPPAAPKTFAEAEFIKSADDVSLIGSVDHPTYRVGDPITLRLELKNSGKRPVQAIPPNTPSNWNSIMGYGVKLARDGKTVLFFPPSDFYEGSYGGPPRFEVLGPGASFADLTSLQYWLSGYVDLPLREGTYEMQITFDSAKFSGIRATGSEVLHRWAAPPISFIVKGPARQDPQELLGLIAATTGDKFLVAHLSSPNRERRDRAWQSTRQYGDSRLDPFLAPLGNRDGYRVRPFVEPATLRPPQSEPPDR
ncbi:hypothetical protein BH10PLA1_BH10PLA1_08150 [soil metagenome]